MEFGYSMHVNDASGAGMRTLHIDRSHRLNRRLALFALMAVLALPFVLAGCGGDSAPNPPLYPMTVTYSVTMTNGSAADTHLFITGEDFDASNKLIPGARRTKNISFTFNGPTEKANIVVRAGRSGTVVVELYFCKCLRHSA